MSTTNSTSNTQTPSRLLAYDSQLPPLHLTSPHTPNQPPSKRLRRTRSMATERASSSSDSLSSGAPDHETEPERTNPPSDAHTLSQTTAPQKKKRTRTLTTPHQSAVLHALLAKSRFPTTAAREEVGRQIGLSARKVQIWFQNQRQKARRPQGDSTPLSRPPQFGPFPIMSPTGPSPSSSYPPPSAGGSSSDQSHSGPSSARSAVRESGGSLDSNPALSGPGMPGQPSSSHPPSAEERLPHTVPTSPLLSHPLPLRLSESTPTRDLLGNTRPPFMAPPPGTSPTTSVETSPHFSRVLPPIHLVALRSSTSAELHLSVSPVSPAYQPPPPPPPQLPSGGNTLPRMSATIVQRHEALGTSRSGTPSPGTITPGIPPPFALQPKPQWDPQAFTPYTRPEFASWSSTGGSSRSSRTSAHVSPDGSRGQPRYTGEPGDHLMDSPSRSHQHPSTSATYYDAGSA